MSFLIINMLKILGVAWLTRQFYVRKNNLYLFGIILILSWIAFDSMNTIFKIILFIINIYIFISGSSTSSNNKSLYSSKSGTDFHKNGDQQYSVGNLAHFDDQAMSKFDEEQETLWYCTECGNVISTTGNSRNRNLTPPYECPSCFVTGEEHFKLY